MSLQKERIGTTLTVVWEVLTSGDAVSLEGRDIRVFAIDPHKKRTEMTDLQIGGSAMDVVTCVFEGKEQEHPGIYQLECIENYNKPNQAVLDDDVIMLVPRSKQRTGGSIGLATPTIQLTTGTLWVGVKGKDGKSAYELAVADGYEGTVTEWLASLHGRDADIAAAEAATDAANAAAAAANDAAEDAEDATTGANTAASAANTAASSANAGEVVRQQNETQRNTNETNRQNAEAQRQQTFQTNEAARQTAYQNAEANRNGAYQEAEDDRDETFNSKEATRDAANQAALNCADTLAALGPKIDQLEAKNFAEVENAPSADLLIADENDKVLVIFSEGELKTKKFDSRKVSQVENADAADFSVTDENGKNIISILYGYPMTKNFDGRAISRKLNTLEQEIAMPNIEGWSKMPKLGQNPLSIVRFDGGMSRIFKNWAFIGDSLNSGEMYGYNDNVITIEEGNVGKEISATGLVTNASYTTTSLYAVSGYQPRIRIAFANSDGLDGKILIAKVVSENEYVALATGVAGTNVYTTNVSANTNIVVSYPSNNKPTITFGITYVSDMYSLSWGQQMVRLLGSKGYNYSVGGESCKRWCTGTNNGRRWERMQSDMQTEVIDAVTIALGVNDKGYWLSGSSSTVDYPCVTAYPQKSQYGSLTLTQEEVLDDIDFSDYTNNANSYAGWYAGIIQRIKSLSPKTHIFCITNPASASEWNQVIRILASKFTELYPNTVWVVDLERYTDDFSQISANCDLHGHWSAFGYLYAAYEISTYIDWLIRNNISAFRATSLIGVANEHKWEV